MGENVSEWFALYCLFYKLTVGFAALRVISSVVIHETFKVANNPGDEISVLQEERRIQKHRTNMMTLMRCVDHNGDGLLDRAEFRTMLKQSSKLKTWLSAQGFECGDSDVLFDLCDGGDGEIDYEKLSNGIQV